MSLVFGYGLCECGCGQKTTIASRTNADRGAVKGEPRRFVRGHGAHNRSNVQTAHPWCNLSKGAKMEFAA